MLSGAGDYTFGKVSPGKVVVASSASSFPIKNASSSKLTLANGFNFTGTTGTVAFSITGTGNIEVTEAISRGGGGNLAVTVNSSGSGAVRLLGANTHNSGTTISAGWVQIGNASALGTGTVTMTGGKLSSSSTTEYFLANAITLNGTMTIGDTTNNGRPWFNGVLTLAGNTNLSMQSQIVFAGAGTSSSAYNFNAILPAPMYFLGGAGTFAGGTASFTGGIVLLANYNNGTPNQFAGFSTLTFNSDAQINGNTAHTFANIIGGTGTVYVRNTSASGITFNGSMASYTGSLRAYADSAEGTNPVQKVTLTRADQFNFGSFWFQSGGGVTSLSQTLSYTGSSPVNMGAPFFVYVGAGPATTTKFSNNSSNGSTFTQSNVLQLATAIGSTFTVDAATGPVVLRALQETSTGVLAVSKTGSNVATIAGPDASNYRGAVQVTTGTLNANSTTALGLATSTAGISVTSGATLSLGAAATYASRVLTVAGNGSVSAPNNGALIVANAGMNTLNGITLTGPTYIRATNNGSINAPFTPNNNSVTFGASSSSNFIPFASLSNVFSGTGSVTYGGHSLDTGIVRADVRHTYTGNTTLAFGTTYVDSSLELPTTGGPLGNKSLTAANTLLMTGGTLSYNSGNVDYSGRFSTAGGQQWRIDATNADLGSVTFATALVGASSFVLSGGSLTLSSASSTFSGGVTISAGTLYAGAAQNGVSGPLGITGTITFSPAGTGVLAYTSASAAFDYSSRFATTSGQTRRINANGESVTFSTPMGGTNAFALVGSAGILTLAVANTYSQGTTLSVGVLKCGDVASLGTGALAQANGTTLHVTATNGKLTIQGAHTNTGSGIRTIRIGA